MYDRLSHKPTPFATKAYVDTLVAGGGPPTGPAGGDFAGTFPNPILKTVNTTPGKFGGPQTIPQLVVNGKGLVTGVVNVPIAFPFVWDGEDGDVGPMGPPGVAGVAGASGATGRMGPPGMDGEDSDEWASLVGQQTNLNQGSLLLLGAHSAYNEASQFLGIGTTNPLTHLHVKNVAAQFNLESTTAGSPSINLLNTTHSWTLQFPNTTDFVIQDDINTRMYFKRGGDVAIGTASPLARFDVGAGKFLVDSNGNIVKVNNVTTSFPASQGVFGSILTNDGSGNLTWTTGSGNGFLGTGQRFGFVWKGPTTNTTQSNIVMTTRSARGTSSSTNDATGAYINYATTTSAASVAGWTESTSDDFQTRFNPVLMFAMKTGSVAADIAGVRIWIGAFSTTPEGADDPATVHLAGFRYSTGAGDVNWQVFTKDGTTLSAATDSGVAVATDTRYTFRIDSSDPTSIKFYINDTLVATKTLNLPTTSTDLGMMMCATNTTAGTARNIKVSKLMYIAN